jgi:hypothetical protein
MEKDRAGKQLEWSVWEWFFGTGGTGSGTTKG